MSDDNTNKKKISNIEYMLNLEFLGIRFEANEEENASSDLHNITKIYFSVPESSTIEIEGKEEINPYIKTAESLISFAKSHISHLIMIQIKKEFDEEGDDEYYKNIISDSFKFYARIRKGEVWTKEDGDKRVKELIEELKKVPVYKEV